MNIFFGFVFGVLFSAVAGNFQDHVWFNHRAPPPEVKESKAAEPTRGLFVQKLDNFDNKNTQKWNMRYYYSWNFFKPGGPIFIMLGGEGPISSNWLKGGTMYDMASQNGAVMYIIEHRYYGESRPFLVLTVENLKYLNTPQAMEDYAVFIRYLKTDPRLAKSKVVVFGGSYPGDISIWMRQQYPNLIHAALSSSAPVLAKVDFKEYFEVVQRALSDPNPNCVGVIKNGIVSIQNYLASGRNGVQKIQKDYNLCREVNVTDFYDKSFFYLSVASTFSSIVQYAEGNDLSNTCHELMNASLPNDYTRLSTFVKNRRKECYGNYKDFVNYYSSAGVNGDYRQWLYQTCNEFGFFQTSGSNNQPFGNNFPVDLNYGMCRDVFNSNFGANRVAAGVSNTNNRYGGLHPKVTRVVSAQGTYDPWSELGLKKDLNVDAPVILIARASHCTDLNGYQNSDPQPQKDAILREQSLIKKWVNTA